MAGGQAQRPAQAPVQSLYNPVQICDNHPPPDNPMSAPTQHPLPRDSEMLTEADMRRALFGSTEATQPAAAAQVAAVPAGGPREGRKSAKPFTPKLKVTLQVSNEYEGRTYPFVYEADTLSRLQAELDAKRAARKKYKYIEVVSITGMTA